MCGAVTAIILVGQAYRNHLTQVHAVRAPAEIKCKYPLEGTLFPPDFAPPTILWHDPDTLAVTWTVRVFLPDGIISHQVPLSAAAWNRGEIDTRCVSAANELPVLPKELANVHAWKPDSSLWSNIKQHSVENPVTVEVAGFRRTTLKKVTSRGLLSIRTSSDSVGAPLFYRDVPLMPSSNEKGVIKPLDQRALPLIAWRLRDISQPKSKVIMQGLHTCTNCHSVSGDGATIGLDLDGPRNDKGLYAIVPIQKKMSIRKSDLISWSSFQGNRGSTLRVGFMSQLSPDGEHVVTTIHDPGINQTDYERHRNPVDLTNSYYVANFMDYRFLQVFYPTRGVLAWYHRKTGQLACLPGADDTNFVQTNAVWSPDGSFLVFARAKARDSYPKGAGLAKVANDANETPIQYDLYRIPFNNGRGGIPVPITGASNNGMSNSFPKISPDGKWIVYVQSKNGLLMRPDGQLYIVPVTGGAARRMTCNTSIMNSWHSFSPNSRWMVFSSKSRSAYTQMFLTHLDDSGYDSPPVLIENSTAANRAVNLPEFVNFSYDAIDTIETPAADYARHVDYAVAAMKNGNYQGAIQEWKKALDLSPSEPWLHNSLGVALMEAGEVQEALTHYQIAIELNPHYAEAYNNSGEALATKGDDSGAIVQFLRALELDTAFTAARTHVGMLLAGMGRMDEAILHMRKVATDNPDAMEAQRNLGHALAQAGKLQDAELYLRRADRLADGKDPFVLHLLSRVYADLGRSDEAIRIGLNALSLAEARNNRELAQSIADHLNQIRVADKSTPP